jgi:hypothetical protein
MNRQQLLTEAKNTVFHLKKEEQRNINPYAAFAHQMVVLIGAGKISIREEVLEYTRLSYPRPGLNRQWRVFGNVLEKHLKSSLLKEDMLLFFGYLKRLLTIEGKKQAQEGNEEGERKYDNRYKRDNRSQHYGKKKR